MPSGKVIHAMSNFELNTAIIKLIGYTAKFSPDDENLNALLIAEEMLNPDQRIKYIDNCIVLMGLNNGAIFTSIGEKIVKYSRMVVEDLDSASDYALFMYGAMGMSFLSPRQRAEVMLFTLGKG